MNKRNPWRFQKKSLELILDPIPEEDVSQYEFDLEKCTTSAETLDQIIQVAEKAWVPNWVLGELVRKVNEKLVLQANLCGGGREMGPINIKELLK